MRNKSLSFHLWVDDDHAFKDEKNSNPESRRPVKRTVQRRPWVRKPLQVRRLKKFKSIRKSDLVLWRTFSIGKWRVNVFKANEFSIGKWRVNVFIISKKIGSGERFRSGNEEWVYSKLRVSEKIGSGERFRSGNEEWMYSNIPCDLLNNYEFEDKKNSSRSEEPVERFEDDHEFQRRLHFR